MSRFGQSCTLMGLILALFLTSSGCVRPGPAVPTEGSAPTGQTPFQDHKNSGADDGPQTAALIEKSVSENLPFENSQVLPQGTLLTVKLKSPITAKQNGSKKEFEAVIDEPVIVDGMTLVARGAIASGRVGAAEISSVSPDRGYVKLSLESLNLDGVDLPVQTATLFARQISGDLNSGTIRLEKGRRLTFRLTEPFNLGSRHSSSGR